MQQIPPGRQDMLLRFESAAVPRLVVRDSLAANLWRCVFGRASHYELRLSAERRKSFRLVISDFCAEATDKATRKQEALEGTASLRCMPASRHRRLDSSPFRNKADKHDHRRTGLRGDGFST